MHIFVTFIKKEKEIVNLRKYLIVLDLRSSPGRMSCSAPEQDLVASPDCSIICDDQDFFKLVR